MLWRRFAYGKHFTFHLPRCEGDFLMVFARPGWWSIHFFFLFLHHSRLSFCCFCLIFTLPLSFLMDSSLLGEKYDMENGLICMLSVSSWISLTVLFYWIWLVCFFIMFNEKTFFFRKELFFYFMKCFDLSHLFRCSAVGKFHQTSSRWSRGKGGEGD